MLKLTYRSAQDRVSNRQQFGGLPNAPMICGRHRKTELFQIDGVHPEPARLFHYLVPPMQEMHCVALTTACR
jgi:hypothetical protein